MDIKKILILLIALIIYVNYENYIKIDPSMLLRREATLEANIKREQKITKEHLSKDKLMINYSNLFFNGKKYTFSEAMGIMQNDINSANKDLCKVKNIKWAPVPTSQRWYDKLQMNVNLSCSPKAFFQAINRLNRKKLYIVKNLHIYKSDIKKNLNITMKLIAFRIKNEHK